VQEKNGSGKENMKGKNFRIFVQLQEQQYESGFDLMLMSKVSQEISATDQQL